MDNISVVVRWPRVFLFNINNSLFSDKVMPFPDPSVDPVFNPIIMRALSALCCRLKSINDDKFSTGLCFIEAFYQRHLFLSLSLSLYH